MYLVGAGPGDPDLLTVKAQRLLRQADVVVYDRLISPAILDLIPPGTSRIYVGKATGRHSMPQEDINELLLNLARKGHQVVRLKGGDPFVFGRGSEEARHLARHGIHFEVVPGITSAAACSAYAGIPLSHRGLARSVRFVTGHCRADQPLELDWQGMADPQTTLVIYMGLANLAQIRQGLLDAGMAPDTLAAFVENGTTPRQRRILTTLGDLERDQESHGVQAPALIIIGKVVDFAHELNWFMPAESTEERDHDAQQVG
ncbi:MAG TPA: uroporphyrinogen-III C-methyltransferase [Gammaproteobacteria bacterium]